MIAADQEMLMVHPLNSGKVEIMLKEPAALKELPPGTLFFPQAAKHTLDLKTGQTHLFELYP